VTLALLGILVLLDVEALIKFLTQSAQMGYLIQETTGTQFGTIGGLELLRPIGFTKTIFESTSTGTKIGII